jgi:hypothetical protein
MALCVPSEKFEKLAQKTKFSLILSKKISSQLCINEITFFSSQLISKRKDSKQFKSENKKISKFWE